MRNIFFPIILLLALIAGGTFVLNYHQTIEYVAPGAQIALGEDIKNQKFIEKSRGIIIQAQALIAEAKKYIEEEQEKRALIKEAQEKSSQVKGIYVGAAYYPSYFKNLLSETELNGVVIDVKEYYGTNLPASLKNLIADLHQEDNWAIARVVVFRDSSLLEEKPEWYLRISTSTEATSSDSLWQDGAGNYWLDPQNKEVQGYIINFSKEVIDFGFDELQFDYIRYPDDYLQEVEKQEVIGDFFLKVSEELKDYKTSIILSVDLFGYVATQFNSYGTGQRLVDAGKAFDYLSFMLYPSHFYGGFWTDEVRRPYPEVVEHPDEVIYYSVKTAYDYLALFDQGCQIRPWLQDFDLGVDEARGVLYDAPMVRAQIEASQNATSSGWLLWNPSYTYTRDALE